MRECAPIFRKAYTVPLRLKEKVIQHLDSLEESGIITPIQASDWASPVVAIVKKDNDIRLVIDCKVSINKFIVPNTYPLPLAQDIFATLAGCKLGQDVTAQLRLPRCFSVDIPDDTTASATSILFK